MYSITKNGNELDPSKYVIDEENKTFSSKEYGLVLNFSNESGWYFNTGYNCTFDTGRDCTFDTGSNCTFDTGCDCTFDTGCDCTFDTSGGCTFKTGFNCTFNTGYNCTFNTGSDCTFDTGCDCTFNTSGGCTFNVLNDIKSIKLIKDSCIVLRGDVTEVVDLNYYIENNPKLENFEMGKPSKEALELLSILSSNNDFMLNLRKPNVQKFMVFCKNE